MGHVDIVMQINKAILDATKGISKRILRKQTPSVPNSPFVTEFD